MSQTARFGISIDRRLLERFDGLIAAKGTPNRSEAIRDLIRSSLVDKQWEHGERETVGTVTLVYEHRTRELSDKLNARQHVHHDSIVSVLHVHLDRTNCLEVAVLKGRAKDIKLLADRLIGTKGVKHGTLTMTTLGKELE